METTILYGNGINLLGGGKSWNQVLKDISEKTSLPPIQSNTLKYEYIILPQKETNEAFLMTEDGSYFVTEDDKFFLTIDVNTEENLKENLSILLIIYTIGVLSGIVIELIGMIL